MADYYDIHAILAEEQRLPVVFTVGSTGLGRAIDPSCDDQDVRFPFAPLLHLSSFIFESDPAPAAVSLQLSAGTSVDVPFWMVPALSARRMVTVKQPRFYGERLKKELEADPGCVDLRDKCEYFYDFGLRLHTLVAGSGLANFILRTFRGRFAALLARAHGVSAEESTRIRRLLTNEERHLFDLGQSSAAQLLQWRSTSTTRQLLKAQPLVERERLRKRLRDQTNK